MSKTAIKDEVSTEYLGFGEYEVRWWHGVPEMMLAPYIWSPFSTEYLGVSTEYLVCGGPAWDGMSTEYGTW